MGQNRILGAWVVVFAGFRLGDLEAVRQAEAEIREDKQFDNAHIATRALAAGMLAGLEGRRQDAVEAFRAGVRYFDLAGWRYWSAHTKSVALTALPGEPAFDGWAQEARLLFESVGAKPDLAWLDEALAKRAATDRSTERPGVQSSR